MLSTLKPKQSRTRLGQFVGIVLLLSGTALWAQTNETATIKQNKTETVKKENSNKSARASSVTPAKPTNKWTKVWWTDRHKEKVERIKKGNVQLLMIGDSITHAWETHGKRIWAKYYKTRNAVNLGFSGDRTEHVLWRIQHGEVDHISPKVVVLLIGTNNTAGKDSAKKTFAGINAIVKELKTRLPTTRILLLAIFPRGEKPNTPLRKRNDKVNLKMAKLADQKQIFFLNINARFFNKQKKLPPEIMPDFLHPNERGYRVWAEAMEPTLKRLMAMPSLK